LFVKVIIVIIPHGRYKVTNNIHTQTERGGGTFRGEEVLKVHLLYQFPQVTPDASVQVCLNLTLPTVMYYTAKHWLKFLYL